MIYDVYYFRNGVRLPDYDRGVGETYVNLIPSWLPPDETAYAECLNDPQHSLDIDRNGVRKAAGGAP